MTLAAYVGQDPAAMWALAWTLFVLRVVLGFLAGIDEVAQLPHQQRDAATREMHARPLRRANMLVTVRTSPCSRRSHSPRCACPHLTG